MSGSIRYQSDGIVIELADGRTVRPALEDGGEGLFANAVWVEDEEKARYGKDADDPHVTVAFEEVED